MEVKVFYCRCKLFFIFICLLEHKFIPGNRRLPDQWSLYNDWSQGDTMLDWNGAEAGQGQHSGQNALGTPAGWTSSNPGKGNLKSFFS